MTEPTPAPSTIFRSSPGAVAIERDVVRAAGPETEAFLQGQLSQDVASLAPGDSAWTFLLQPQGKVDAWLRVTRMADDTFVLDVDGGWGDAVQARLDRFKLRTKCTIEVLAWRSIAVRGPGSDEIAAAVRLSAIGDTMVVPLRWPAGVSGFDLFGPGVTEPSEAAPATLDDYERLRIDAGVPAMGAELTDQTIPAEMGPWLIDVSVSFTKGCYTGQELVARIDSRGGNVPRRLRRITWTPADDAGEPNPPAGAELVVAAGDGKVVGSLTSVAPGAAVALGLVQRSVEPPAELEIRHGAATWAARVDPLPESLLS